MAPPATDARTPTVTCVVTTYNYGRYVGEAVRSALAQTYPPEALEVVVVNDGSSDDTERILEAGFGHDPRVRLIHQANAGFVGAMNVGLSAATGDLIALLDGDDTWPPDRLARQVERLVARPEVGLVHGDMTIVDAAGATLHPSFFAYSRFEVPRGRVLAKLMRGPNFVAGGASVVRADLLRAVLPIPGEVIYPDWYIAVRIAERAEIDHVEGSVNLYRMHGSNMGLGGVGRKFYEDMRNNVNVRRWMLRHVDTGGEAIAELGAVADAMLLEAQQAAFQLGTLPARILTVTAAEREAAATEIDLAVERFDAEAIEPAARAFLRALALDPWNGEAQAGLRVTRGLLERTPAIETVPAADAFPTRGTVILALADELVEDPSLLVAYGERVSGEDDVTLLIWAADAAGDAGLAAVEQLVERAGLAGADAADLLLHQSRDVADVLPAAPRVLLSRRPVPAGLAGIARREVVELEA